MTERGVVRCADCDTYAEYPHTSYDLEDRDCPECDSTGRQRYVNPQATLLNKLDRIIELLERIDSK